jgi:hypothetical protein
VDDEARILLGLPTVGALDERLLEEVSRRGADGISPREMAKRNPDASLLDWMQSGARLHRAGKVSHTWSPLKNDLAAAQESRYSAPGAPCP